MARIDLVTIVHPDDKRDPKFKYTFKAPSNSDIKIDDYVIADIKGKESLGKVVSVLEDIDEDSETLNYIRSVSTIGDQEIKPLSYKLRKIKLFDNPIITNKVVRNLIEAELGRTNALKAKAAKERIYFSIDQQITCSGTEMHHSLIVSSYEYNNDNNDNERIDARNVFFDYLEAIKIVEIIMGNVDDDSQFIDIKAELKKIL